MKDVLLGWGEIAKYLGCHLRTAQRYACRRRHPLPVHRRPGGGPKAPVFAVKSELDRWYGVDTSESDQSAGRASLRNAELAEPVLKRILGIGRDTKLYRRDYVLRFDLKRHAEGVRVDVEYRFELCNATEQEQPFVQELTVDDSDHGFVNSMSLSANGRPAYRMTSPAPTTKPIGYAVYRGPKQLIAPSDSGVIYVCRASWVIHRSENDIWYNHMALPTVGMRVETHAPATFEITPSFSAQGLVMTGEHSDIAWRRRS